MNNDSLTKTIDNADFVFEQLPPNFQIFRIFNLVLVKYCA